MSSDFGVLVAAAGCWLAFGYKLRHLRTRTGGPALRALVVLLGLSATLATLTPPTVGRVIDPAVGLPGATRFAANVTSMTTCLVIIVWLLYLSRPEAEARHRMMTHLRIWAAVVAGVLVLYSVDHPPVTARRPFAGHYNYLFLLYDVYAVTALIGLSWRYAAMASAPLMRLGLRLVAVACVMGLLSGALLLIYLASDDLHLDLPGSTAGFIPLFATSEVVFIVGMTLPSWGPRVGLEALWWRVTRWIAIRRLRHLWRLVTSAHPGVVLDRRLLEVSPFGERLAANRLPVEIHDTWLHLRAYLSVDDAALIDRLAALRSASDSQVAAARLMAAIRRKATADGPAPSTPPPTETLGGPRGRNLLDEVRFLAEVSHATQSRFVRDVLSQLGLAAGPSPHTAGTAR